MKREHSKTSVFFSLLLIAANLVNCSFRTPALKIDGRKGNVIVVPSPSDVTDSRLSPDFFSLSNSPISSNKKSYRPITPRITVTTPNRCPSIPEVVEGYDSDFDFGHIEEKEGLTVPIQDTDDKGMAELGSLMRKIVRVSDEKPDFFVEDVNETDSDYEPEPESVRNDLASHFETENAVTQVETEVAVVEPVIEAFADVLKKYPTFDSISKCSLDEIIKFNDRLLHEIKKAHDFKSELKYVDIPEGALMLSVSYMIYKGRGNLLSPEEMIDDMLLGNALFNSNLTLDDIFDATEKILRMPSKSGIDLVPIILGVVKYAKGTANIYPLFVKLVQGGYLSILRAILHDPDFVQDLTNDHLMTIILSCVSNGMLTDSEVFDFFNRPDLLPLIFSTKKLPDVNTTLMDVIKGVRPALYERYQSIAEKAITESVHNVLREKLKNPL